MNYNANPKRYGNGMKYRKCGNSGILLSEISLGLWHNFGDIDGYKNALEIVEFAFDSGITHFDLANNYGPPPGSAEANFGKMLSNEFSAHRDKMVLSTKAGHLMWPGPYGDGGSRKHLITSINHSLKRLKTDYVDIFYSHRFDPKTPLEETLDALIDIVKQGKALYIGLSKYPATELKTALEYFESHNTRCLIYQDRYNLLTRKVEIEHTDILQKHQCGYIAFSPLAQGLLSEKYIEGIPEYSRAARPEGYLKKEDITPDIIRRVLKMRTIANDRKQSVAELAISWLLKDNTTTSVISGCSSVNQLKKNIMAINNTSFSKEELNAIEALFPKCQE